MKAKILGLMAVALFSFSSASHALVITISGSGSGADGQWDVSTVFGGAELVGTLDDQVWWGNADLARLFAITLGDQLGFPNSAGTFPRGPAFAFLVPTDQVNGERFAYRWSCDSDLPACQVVGQVAFSFRTQTYAIATRVAAVPEPGAFALLSLGLAGLGLSRRRKAN